MTKLFRLVIKTSGVYYRPKTFYVIATDYTDAISKFEGQKIMDVSLVGSSQSDNIFEDIEW